MRNLGNLTRSTRTLKPTKQFDQAVLAALGDNLDPSIDKVFRGAEQAEFERVTPDPPAKADPLDPAAHPGREPGLSTCWLGAAR